MEEQGGEGQSEESQEKTELSDPDTDLTQATNEAAPPSSPLPPSSPFNSSPAPAEPVLSAVVHQVAQLGENVRGLLSSLHHPAKDQSTPNHESGHHFDASTDLVSPLVGARVEPMTSPIPSLPHSNSPYLSSPSSSSSAPLLDWSPPPSTSLSPPTTDSHVDGSASTSSTPFSSSSSPPDDASSASSTTPVDPSSSDAVAVDDRERRKTERKAKREKKKRERQSAIERQFGNLRVEGAQPPVISSSTLSDDGQYEVRKEVIGYMRGGRLVGEMSLLTTAAVPLAPPSPPIVAPIAVPSIPLNPSTSSPASAPTASSSPSDYLAPSFVASSSPSIATATVTCVEKTRVLVWSRDSLRSLFFRFPTLSVGWYAIVSSDLVHRLSEARHLSLYNGYKLLLLGICAEGKITAKQKAAADEYRRLNSITEDDHAKTLRDLGWTKAEWDRGSKKVGWIEHIGGQWSARRGSI
jgi:CRP-like cAMP-binding protein